MQRNAELFKAVAEKIRKDRKHYDQTAWIRTEDPHTDEPCGTTCCIAGWATVLSGRGVPSTKKFSWGHAVPVFRNKYRHMIKPWAVARQELGLTRSEARILFDEEWRPKRHIGVPKALERLAEGASVESVTDPETYAVLAAEAKAAGIPVYLVTRP